MHASVHVYRALPPDRAICAFADSGAVCEVRLKQPVPESLYRAFVMRPLPAALAGELKWDAKAGAFEAEQIIATTN
jgi:hypothetical protein